MFDLHETLGSILALMLGFGLPFLGMFCIMAYIFEECHLVQQAQPVSEDAASQDAKEVQHAVHPQAA